MFCFVFFFHHAPTQLSIYIWYYVSQKKFLMEQHEKPGGVAKIGTLNSMAKECLEAAFGPTSMFMINGEEKTDNTKTTTNTHTLLEYTRAHTHTHARNETILQSPQIEDHLHKKKVGGNVLVTHWESGREKKKKERLGHSAARTIPICFRIVH